MSNAQKFKVGDTLLVVESGNSYSGHHEMAALLGISDIFVTNRWAMETLDNGITTVVVKSYHSDGYYGVVDEQGRGWVMDEDAFELVKPANLSWQQLSELHDKAEELEAQAAKARAEFVKMLEQYTKQVIGE